MKKIEIDEKNFKIFFLTNLIKGYNVHFGKVKFENISSGIRDMILEPNTFGKNLARRTFW